jgi:pyruvate/2-oxoglutarate dehydrogenase complex dihydrolipoamide dehydrogenase (E3) component
MATAMTRHFDAIIIGAGQAGPALADRLTKAGKKVAVVERKLFGGTCVNTGCTPTKTMVASAYAMHMAQRGNDFGFQAGPITVDMKAVKARKDAVAGKSRTGVEGWLRAMEGCTVYQGQATFLSAHELKVGDETLTADSFFINVGGRATVPDMPGVHDVPFLTNSTFLDLEVLPEHLVIVGGGYIGLEFAQMYRRFGSEVTVVEMGPRLVRHEDADVCDAIRQILEEEGVHVRLDAECIAFKQVGDKIGVQVNCTDGEPEVLGSHVLLAVGRRPNTDDLGLALAGVKVDEHGYIVVDDHLKTSAGHIWAMGDCNGQGAFTHTAYNDFEIVADNLLDGGTRSVTDRIQAHALYIDPPLGQIGMTEEQVRKSGKAALMSTRPMTRVNRALEKGESKGFMKVLVDAGDLTILGASILGIGGDEAIHCILDVMYAKQPYTTIRNAVHIHPTVSELIPTLLGDLKPLD